MISNDSKIYNCVSRNFVISDNDPDDFVEFLDSNSFPKNNNTYVSCLRAMSAACASQK